jgi:hypothetical protein
MTHIMAYMVIIKAQVTILMEYRERCPAGNYVIVLGRSSLPFGVAFTVLLLEDIPLCREPPLAFVEEPSCPVMYCIASDKCAVL